MMELLDFNCLLRRGIFPTTTYIRIPLYKRKEHNLKGVSFFDI